MHMNTENPQAGIRVSLDELISARVLAQRLRLTPRTAAMAARGGAHLSRSRGRGIDFDEVRIYQPGDDIRSMDWRVTARTGRPHSKIFREERERPVLFAVDYSASMQFGTRVVFKSVIAAKVAAFWAWCSARHGDRIGGVVFSEAGGMEVKPRSGQSGVLRLLRALAEYVPGAIQEQGVSVQQALQHVRSVARPGSLIVFISDFWGWNPACEAHLSDLQRHSEFMVVQVYDSMEMQLPPPGRYNISDGRAALSLDTTNATLRAAYQQRFVQHAQEIKNVMQQHAVKIISIATHDDPYTLLSRELRVMYGR